MKRIFTLLTVTIFTISFATAQQISNGGFETWANGKPQAWSTTKSGLSTTTFTSNLETQETNAANVHSGTSAIKIVSGFLSFYGDTVSGAANYGVGVYESAIDDINFYGTPFAFRPDSFSFAYKYTPAGNDSAGIGIYLAKGTTDVGYNDYILGASASYKVVTQKINYVSAIAPDSVYIYLYSSGLTQANNGSALWVDDVKVIYKNAPNGVDMITNEPKLKMYPNPANAILNIIVADEMIGNTIQLMDMTGRVIVNENLTDASNSISVAELSAGVYLYRIIGDKNNTTASGKFIKE